MPRPIIQGPYRTFRRLNEEQTFLEFEGSTITIPMKARRGAGEPWMHDEIRLNAFMRLEIYPPYVNNLGTREFQFTIRDWELYGKSPMLNLLFFDDPRGQWVQNKHFADYVPACVTFNVSHNYHIKVDPRFDFTACELFGSERELELRNLTSHHTRVWVELRERERPWFYSHPEGKLYWQLYPAGIAQDPGVRACLGTMTGPVFVLHKKRPVLGMKNDQFDVTDPIDRARYLVAAAQATQDAQGVALQPIEISPTTEISRNQLHGNAVLSSLYRPRQPLQVRWRFGRGIRSVADLTTRLDGLLKRHGPGDGAARYVSGHIDIVSPARSLGTAEQGPDVGHPVDSTDFPARLTYAINYDIRVNKELFVEDQAGIAIAVGAVEVPPRDVTVAFDKPHVGHVLARYLEFGPGHCTGMHEITSEAYRDGVNYCRYWRGVPLDPNDPSWNDMEDYNPSHDY